MFPAVVIPALVAPGTATLTVLRDYSTIISAPTNNGGAPSAGGWSIAPVGSASALVDLGLQFDANTGEITAIANANSEGPLLTQEPGGSYTITATNSAGSSSVTLVIQVVKATADVAFDSTSLTATYASGTPRAAAFDINTNSVTRPGTVLKPNALVAYAGTGSTIYASTSTAPTNAGTYSVTVTCVDAYFTCSGTAALTIYKASVILTMPDVNVTYDGNSHPASAVPSSPVTSISYLYDSVSSSAPISVGAHTAMATVVDPNYTGSATAAVNISAVPVVYLVSNQTVVYDGTEHVPTVSVQGGGSVPPYTIALNGDTVPGFTDVGVYNYVISATSTNYSGTANGRFIVTQASQTIVFAALNNMNVGEGDQALVAYTTSNGVATTNIVTLASNSTGVCTVVGSAVHVIAVGQCSITASQAGDGNYSAAISVTRTFNVGFRLTGTTSVSTTVGTAPAYSYTCLLYTSPSPRDCS